MKLFLRPRSGILKRIASPINLALVWMVCLNANGDPVYYNFAERSHFSGDSLIAVPLYIELTESVYSTPIAPAAAYDRSDPSSVAASTIYALQNDEKSLYNELTGDEEYSNQSFDFSRLRFYSHFDPASNPFKLERVVYFGNFAMFSASGAAGTNKSLLPFADVFLENVGGDWYTRCQMWGKDWVNHLVGLRAAQKMYPSEFQPISSPPYSNSIGITSEPGCSPSDPCMNIFFQGEAPQWGRHVLLDYEYLPVDPLLPPPGETYGEQIKFYRDTMLVLLKFLGSGADFDGTEGKALASRVSPMTRGYMQEMASEGNDQWVYYAGLRARGNTIQYVLDADPFFFFFVNFADEWTYDPMWIDVIQRHGDTYKLVSWGDESIITKFLESEQVWPKMKEFIQTQNE